MARKNVTVRLDSAELLMLRSLTGKTDSDKLRNLIRSVGATDGFSAKIAGAVRQENAGLLAGFDKHFTAAEQRIIAANRALIERLVAEMNKPFTQILDYVRGQKR